MKIDLTCPAEILRCRLSDNSGSGAEVTLNNLAGKKVVSCEVTLVLHGREEEDTTRVVYRCHDLKAAPGTPFSFDVPFPDQSPRALRSSLKRSGTTTPAYGAAAARP